jgi:hypothetical protein
MPDLIDLAFIHEDYLSSYHSMFMDGIYIFVNECLGEQNLMTMIDDLTIEGVDTCKTNLIPVSKLKQYLIWREKEFIEKTGHLRYLKEFNDFGYVEAELENGKTFISFVDRSLLKWDGKASHPWIVEIEIKYPGDRRNGMPGPVAIKLMHDFEEQLGFAITPELGYLNVGYKTADSLRTIYFACAEFRKPVRVIDHLITINTEIISVSYDVYKDKYWQTLDQLLPESVI